MDVKEMYPCFSTYELDQSTEEDDHGVNTPSNPATPCTPITPHTPGTPASHSMSDDADKSAFSLSMDSGIGSPQPFSLPNTQIHNIINVRSLAETPKTSKMSKAADHTNKEKQRRERIKDSCDQLRVLLPYIRGRKTDMASILEMCVDYLRIVNAFMPQSLQDQIVDILSKDPTLIPNRDLVLGDKSKCHSADLDPKVNTSTSSRSNQTSQTSGMGKKKSSVLSLAASELSTSPCDVRALLESKSKRLRLQETSDCTTESSHLDARLDPTVAGHSDISSYTLPSSQMGGLHHSKSFQDLEDPSYPRLFSGPSHSDGYNTAQQIFNAYTTSKTSNLDTDPLRPMYMDSALYHYYPSVLPNTVSQTRLYTPPPEYVNPNSVLSTSSYSNFRLKSGSSSSLKAESSYSSITGENTNDGSPNMNL